MYVLECRNVSDCNQVISIYYHYGEGVAQAFAVELVCGLEHIIITGYVNKLTNLVALL